MSGTAYKVGTDAAVAEAAAAFTAAAYSGKLVLAPTDLTFLNPVDLFRADTLSAGAVATWANQGSAGNIAQGTAGRRPVKLANWTNGRPAVTFDGVDDYLTRASSPFAGAAARTIYVVMQTNTTGGIACCYGQGGGWFGTGIFQQNIVLITPTGLATFSSTDLTAFLGVPIVLKVAWSGSGQVTMKVNATPLVLTGASPGTDSADFFSVGNYENAGPGAAPLPGQIAEICSVPGTVSAPDDTKAYAYFQSWYGIH